jgi:hypothetical protein
MTSKRDRLSGALSLCPQKVQMMESGRSPGIERDYRGNTYEEINGRDHSLQRSLRTSARRGPIVLRRDTPEDYDAPSSPDVH